MPDDYEAPTVDRRPGVAVVHTHGYVNNAAAEEIAAACYELIDEGRTALVLNLADTKLVNDIGMSILTEIIDRTIEAGGRLCFCCLTPVTSKTFQIMGLDRHASIFSTEDEAVATIRR